MKGCSDLEAGRKLLAPDCAAGKNQTIDLGAQAATPLHFSQLRIFLE